MPAISRFYGIRITMKPEENERHHVSHFHVHYGGYEAVYSCKGDLLSGKLPFKQDRLVKAWASLHETELEENWYLASNHAECYRIDPLH